MKDFPTNILTFTLTIFLLAYIIADCFFRESAFESSNTFASFLQSKLDPQFFKNFFLSFSHILHPIATSIILMAYYTFSSQKIRILAFFIYFFLITYLCSILKLIYHDPRPYWMSQSVQAFECLSEYGNPSGHSMMSILLFGTLWHRHIWALVRKGEVGVLKNWQTEQINENLIKDSSEKEISENNLNQSKSCKFCILSFLTFLVIFLILFGRIYLGMHSYNEVFLGFFYGFYFNYMYLMYLEDIFIALLHSIIIKNAHDLRENLKISWLLFGILFAFYMLLLLIPIIAFEFCKGSVSISQIWYQRIKNVCPSNGIFQMFYYKCFLDCGIIGTAFGILFGIIFTKGKHTIALNTGFSHHERINQYLILKSLGRLLTIIILCGGITGVLKIIPNQDIYVNYFVNMNLATFLGGFALIKLVPYIFNKMQIEKEGDFLRYHGGEMILETGGIEDQETNETGTKKEDMEMTIKDIKDTKDSIEDSGSI